eukprot:CAMPEP_0202365188 /NCGR_PEP_ID=MMETSP1126-20121109/16284_1 /ASSEMBLY_ACC=CAM_ASM_000457 /TAXON_ID=3047 /ORGANISM="Dunaliella tertiolecta, Strain CCMP1320" /LENGTH=56 /DNA_ID=CAMNT_0048959957 /DNA_START=186 /DNA_END=356 /DNA_ORIENTATION=+
MFAQLGQEEQELQQLHERMRAAAVKGREHGRRGPALSVERLRRPVKMGARPVRLRG